MCVVNLIYAAKQSNYCIVCPSFALLSLVSSVLLLLLLFHNVVVVLVVLCLLLLVPSFLFVSFSACHFVILPVGFGLRSVPCFIMN